MNEYKPISEFSHRGRPLREILLDHENWIKKRVGEKADLIDANLNGVDLRGAYLRGADLIKADLRDADLREANLSEANLFGANLTGTKMIGSNLRRVNLEKANLSEANLSGSDLTEANLKGAYLAWANLIRSNLSEANLSEAYMRGADLTLCDLSKARMPNAKMIGTNLSESNLGGANLAGANLNEAHLRRADLSYADLSRADMSEANYENADLRSADLSNAVMASASLIGADLSDAILNGIWLHRTKISQWNIAGVSCTHIFRGASRELHRFNPGEFEKRYSQTRNLSEIVLKVPLTSSGYYIGKFITRAINHIAGARVIDLKGIEVISEEDTKFVFRFYDDDFFDKSKEAFEINLRVTLNKYFLDQAIDKDQSYFGDIPEEKNQALIGEGDTTFLSSHPWRIDHGKMGEKLVEHYSRLGEMGESIYRIIAAVLGSKA
ncbi:MAG: pentapeptide repeat-containing protein [Deltaproteobacteria bacterium]|nr:pentapeptide repeat-containing protein [Deltaproteobacteria bacterium]